MCIEAICNLSMEMYNRSSYCVSKVLFQYLKSPNKYIFTPNLCIRAKNLSTNSQVDVLLNAAQTVMNDDSESEVNKSKSKTYRPKISKEVLDFVQSNQALKPFLNKFPQKLLKRTRSLSNPLYIVDTKIAKSIAESVKNCIDDRDIPTYEAHPGFGILTKELHAAGILRLRLCENSNYFLRHLRELKSQFPAQTEIIKWDILHLQKYGFQDSHDGGQRVWEIFRGVPKVKWTHDPVIRVIASLPSQNFVRYLVKSHIFQNGIFAFGRSEFYFIISPSNYFLLTCNSKDGYMHYRAITVLFQLIFEYQLLMKLPREAFLPWETKYVAKKWSKLKKLQSLDPGVLYLIKVVPRRDFFETVKENNLQPFWYFIWHHLMSRSNKIIPALEKWIPRCGSRLIRNGMTIYSEFGDLTPEEILSLFNEFINWPEYPDCPFLSSMETALMKLEQTGSELGKEMEGEDHDDEDAEEVREEHIVEEERRES